MKQVKRVPGEGPIHLVDDALQVNESDCSKVKMTCRIDGKKYQPPSPMWWSKEFAHLLALRKAAREGAKTAGSSKASSEEPEAKKRKPNEPIEAQQIPLPSGDEGAKEGSVKKPDAATATTASSTTPAAAAAATTAAAAKVPPPQIPVVRERFVNQPRDVTNVEAERIAYLHIYATKAKENKTREKFSAVEARSYFESFGKIKAFWSKKQVSRRAEELKSRSSSPCFCVKKKKRKQCCKAERNLVKTEFV